jgi:hypothetical protein
MAEEERGGRGEGFLSRWSRLKQARREEAAPAPAEPPAPPVAPPVAPLPHAATPADPPLAEPAPQTEDEPEIDLASLPKIEELTTESDLALFLRKGVPEALKNAALRRFWSIDPTIRDFIGPADYAWDWNVPGGAPGYAETIAHGPDVEALADRILGIGREPAEPAPREAVVEQLPEPVAVRRGDERAEPAPADPAEEEGAGEATPVLATQAGEAARLAAPLPAGPASAAVAPAARPEPAPPRHGGAVPV